ncbi:MAG: CpsB/CapC family capsule biosynthesis tyrosine phosphatase [Bacteroidales bacterium]
MFDFLFKKKEEEMLPLPFETDIHCHIIPGVDDGSQDFETSLELIGKMHEWGIRKVIATPHRTDETFENTPEIIEPIYLELKKQLQDHGIDLGLNYSFEYRMDEGFIRLKDANQLRPLKDKYILVENSFIQPLWNLDDLIFELKLQGYKPILAHPERYSYYHTNKKIYQHLHDSECAFQVNILSMAGCYGKGIQDLTLWMLEKGFIDFMATDLHHKQHVQAIDQFLRSKLYRKLRPKLQLKNDLI